MKNNNRTKGHNFEREVVRDLKPLFPYTTTSRASSKLLDDCGVDVNNVPFLIQCKNGYLGNRPKYEVEFEKVFDRLKEKFPKEHHIHQMPFLLIHRLPGTRGKKNLEQNTQVTISYEFFLYLINNLDWNDSKTLTL